MPLFNFSKQLNAMDCGPTCLRMVAKYYGKNYNTDGIRENAGYGKEGTSLLGISDAAEKIGFRTRGVQLTFKQLLNHTQLPCILHWGQNHFVVLVSIKKTRFSKSINILIADPSKSLISYTYDEFIHQWISSINEKKESVGTALFLEPIFIPN